MENMTLTEEIKIAEEAVVIATNVFNDCNEKYLDSAIYELLAAEMRLKTLREEMN